MAVPWIQLAVAAYGAYKNSKDKKSAKQAGALGPLGADFEKFITDRLNTPAGDTLQFRLGSTTIRDALSRQAATQRQQLGDSATAGGFLDSGAVNRGNADIFRGEAAAFSQALSQLLLGLEDQRDDEVLPYLSLKSGRSIGVQQLNQQSNAAYLNLLYNTAANWDASRAGGSTGELV